MKKVQDLVGKKAVASVRVEDTVLTAARKMTDAHVGAVLVLDEEGGLLGIFTERDVMGRVVAAGLDPAQTVVGDVMTSNLYTTSADRSVNEVRREMRERHIRHVPVVDGGRVLAVLGMRDLMRAAFEQKRDEVTDMTAYIRGEGN